MRCASRSPNQSISPSSSMSGTSSGSGQSIWSRISHFIHPRSSSRRSSSQTSSTASCSSTSSRHSSLSRAKHGRRRKELVMDQAVDTPITIPPFSPTYCKPNEFPYSNFYVKLPDGKWMLRYRSGTRDILRTDIISGDMI